MGTNPDIETDNLTLILQTPEETRALINRMSDSDKAELSASWLALVESATSADPWVHGFAVVQRKENVFVGNCGFTGPPTPQGVVEIAYGIDPDFQGNGYATEAAQALISYAFSHSEVSVVLAHTLPQANASTRVLTKCGFRKVGQVVDPNDGPVWRWERQRETA